MMDFLSRVQWANLAFMLLLLATLISLIAGETDHALVWAVVSVAVAIFQRDQKE